MVLHERTETEKLQDELAARLPSDNVIKPASNSDGTVSAEIQSVGVPVTYNPPGDLLDAAERLRWIHVLTAGVGGYDTDRLREQEMVLANTSGVHAQPIGEQVLGYVLVFEHRIRQQERRVAMVR